MSLPPLPFGAPVGYPASSFVQPKERKYKVRNKNATSYEYFVSIALEALKLDYTFQSSYMGGRSVRGGVVVDFVVYTRPLQTPVWVNGEYWHKGKQASIDYYQQIILSQFAGVQFAQPVVFFGEDVNTLEKAIEAVKKEFRP